MMAGLDDLMADSEEEWAKAERYAHGYADHGMGDALWVYYTRYFPAGVLLYVAVVALGGSLLSGEDPTDWLFVAQLGTAFFGLLALAAGLLYNAKRLRPRVDLPSSSAVVLPLGTPEQKYVKRVINSKETVPEDSVRLTVARAVAVQTRKNMATQLLIFPMYSYCLTNVFGGLSILWVALAALMGVVAIFYVREFRRTGRFLAVTAP